MKKGLRLSHPRRITENNSQNDFPDEEGITTNCKRFLFVPKGQNDFPDEEGITTQVGGGMPRV